MAETREFPSGEIGYKSVAEYNSWGRIHGKPFYYVTTGVDKRYYLWQYQIEENNYLLLKSGDEFVPLYEEGLALEDKIREQRAAQHEAGMSWTEIFENETLPQRERWLLL